MNLYLVFLLPCLALARIEYVLRIPNGFRVPDPCNNGTIWQAVGHVSKNGGGERNQFGADFQEANFTWTAALCQKDSDGDGITNGNELGDPNCVWAVGQAESRTVNITNPAVCETCSGTCQATLTTNASTATTTASSSGAEYFVVDFSLIYFTPLITLPLIIFGHP